MTRIAIAASSQIAADAGAGIAEVGGNAVDAALAASLVQLVTEPGIVSLGAGALLTIWPPDNAPNGAPVMIDALSEMPGREAQPGRFGTGGIDVMLSYGGGAPTTVGHGAVATPGAVAGYDLAARTFGHLPWAEVLGPAIRVSREGFAMPAASYQYVSGAYQEILGWNPPALRPLLNARGGIKEVGEVVRIEGLADSLTAIAEEGARAFYEGEIARAIAADVEGNGGLMGLADLKAYEPRLVPALEVALDDWRLATSSLPSIGGATLAAMLKMMDGIAHEEWTAEMVRELTDVQVNIMRYRRDVLDGSTALEGDVAALLDTAEKAPSARSSPSTVHTSVVDESGLACAITASAGYCSGVMPPGTGIWLNNSLGEVELNKRGFHTLKPGERVPSNMAPTVGRSADGSVLSIGSPGADRITTALLQTITNYVHLGMHLEDAVNHPRLHVEWLENGSPRAVHEPGLPVEGLACATRGFDKRDMFFGGVGAVRFTPQEGFKAAADMRRVGGTRIT